MKAIIRGGRLFQIRLLTGSRALNNHIKYTEHWLYKCSKCGSFLNFQCQYPRRQSLNHHWSVLLHQTPLHLCLLSNISCQFSTWQRGDKRKRKWWEGLGAIMLNISVKGGRGDYSREEIDQGTAIIRGNTVPQSFQCRQWNGVAVFFFWFDDEKEFIWIWIWIQWQANLNSCT